MAEWGWDWVSRSTAWSSFTTLLGDVAEEILMKPQCKEAVQWHLSCFWRHVLKLFRKAHWNVSLVFIYSNFSHMLWFEIPFSGILNIGLKHMVSKLTSEITFFALGQVPGYLDHLPTLRSSVIWNCVFNKYPLEWQNSVWLIKCNSRFNPAQRQSKKY